MDIDTERRRFLTLAGTGASVSIAGCASLENGGPQAEDDGTNGEIGDTATVTLALAIDQEALRELQAELGQQLQNGTINQTEAQQQLREAQQEMIAETIDSFSQRAADTDSLTIDETAEQLGIMLVSGTPKALIGTLSSDEVRGLLPEATFSEAQSQSGGF